MKELSYTPWGALCDPATLQPYLPDGHWHLLPVNEKTLNKGMSLIED